MHGKHGLDLGDAVIEIQIAFKAIEEGLQGGNRLGVLDSQERIDHALRHGFATLRLRRKICEERFDLVGLPANLGVKSSEIFAKGFHDGPSVFKSADVSLEHWFVLLDGVARVDCFEHCVEEHRLGGGGLIMAAGQCLRLATQLLAICAR